MISRFISSALLCLILYVLRSYKTKRFTVIKEREALNMKGGQRDVCVFCDAILCPFFYSSFIEDNNLYKLFPLLVLSFLPSKLVYSVVTEFMTHLISFLS